MVVEDPNHEPIFGPVVVAGFYFARNRDDVWSHFHKQFNRENAREWFAYDFIPIELVKFFVHLKK